MELDRYLGVAHHTYFWRAHNVWAEPDLSSEFESDGSLGKLCSFHQALWLVEALQVNVILRFAGETDCQGYLAFHDSIRRQLAYFRNAHEHAQS